MVLEHKDCEYFYSQSLCSKNNGEFPALYLFGGEIRIILSNSCHICNVGFALRVLCLLNLNQSQMEHKPFKCAD